MTFNLFKCKQNRDAYLRHQDLTAVGKCDYEACKGRLAPFHVSLVSYLCYWLYDKIADFGMSNKSGYVCAEAFPRCFYIDEGSQVLIMPQTQNI